MQKWFNPTDRYGTGIIKYEQKLCRVCNKNMTINAYGYCGTCRLKSPALPCALQPIE